MAIRYGVEDQRAIAQANANRAAQKAQADYLARIQANSAQGRRVSPDTAAAGIAASNRTGSSTTPTMSQKPFEQMSKLEQATALSNVNWGGLEDLVRANQRTSGGGQQTSQPVEIPTYTAPTDTGGTPAAAAPVSNVDATSQLFADALKALQDQYGVSQGNINEAIARMEADPYNRMNAYANLQLAPARVAADPLAQYMAASGLSDQQSAAAAQLAQAEADAYAQAMRNVQNTLQQSQEQVNASRLADIGLIRTGAQQDLEANLNMLRLGLERERIGAVTGLQQRNLENEMNMRNTIANQIANVFAGQDVAPESILKLIQETLNRMNMSQWTGIPSSREMSIGLPEGWQDMRGQPTV